MIDNSTGFERSNNTAAMPLGLAMRSAVMAGALLAATEAQPATLVLPLPAGYRVLADAALNAGTSSSFRIVALGRVGEEESRAAGGHAPARPLLIFAYRRGSYVLVGRNDNVVLRADEGGQCDPFLDGESTIAVKGRFFTIENGVACGNHWTDYITFRFEPRSGIFVFDNERAESWKFNPDENPGADALVRDGPPRVTRDPVGHVTPFFAWRRAG